MLSSILASKSVACRSYHPGPSSGCTPALAAIACDRPLPFGSQQPAGGLTIGHFTHSDP